VPWILVKQDKLVGTVWEKIDDKDVCLNKEFLE
jgi:hypothetical protein